MVDGSEFMVVKIRFGQGPVISRRNGKNIRLAMLAASLLTMVSISFASLGMWRVGTDLDWAGKFVYPTGLLSHWQVWIGASILMQYASWRLGRYARISRTTDDEIAARPAKPEPRAAASV